MIVEYSGMGAPPRLVEHPQRPPAASEVELPALPGGEIDKRKLRAFRPDRPRLGADRSRIGDRVTVAREQQMIAVIDGQVGRRIEIGPAAAAGLLRGFVDMHLEIRIRQPTGYREARTSTAIDMDRFLHQMNAYPTRMPIRALSLSP